MSAGTLKTAWWLQVSAQVVTAWTLALALLGVRGFDPMVVVFVLAFYGLALFLPLKNNGTIRDRAVSCLAAGAVLASALSLQLVGMLLTFKIGAVGILSVLGMVLFTVSGSLFWLHREDD